MTPRPDPTLVSVETFKALVMAQPGEVEALLRAGVIQKAAPGRVALIAATRAFVEHVRSKARNASLSTAQEQAKAARAEAAELTLQIENRELVPDADAEATLDHLGAAITSAIACLPSRVTRDLRARVEIDAVLRLAQEAIAADLAKLAG